MNLLDKRYHSYTAEELIASAAGGSLYKKRDRIAIRRVPPQKEEVKLLEIDVNAIVPSRRRSAIKIEQVHFEELDIPDENFAEETADLIDDNYATKK